MYFSNTLYFSFFSRQSGKLLYYEKILKELTTFEMTAGIRNKQVFKICVCFPNKTHLFFTEAFIQQIANPLAEQIFMIVTSIYIVFDTNAILC